jgi:tRNA-modifying protein YgfZ
MLKDVLIAKDAVFTEKGRLESVTSSSDEFKNLETALVVPLLGHTALRVTGADRLDFVHGQVSNEVKRLQVGTFSENLLLNHKGHALAQVRVFRREDDLFLAIENNLGALVERELRAHIIFDQIELQNLSETITSFTVQGKEVAKVLEGFGTVPTGNTFVQIPFASAKILIHAAKRTVPGGFDIHVLSKDAEALLERVLESGGILGGEMALNMSRVEAGTPYAETEAGEGVLPQEAGLEPLVSYTKGCYLGQEIMARIEARGNLHRSLKTLKLTAKPQTSEREIRLADKVVGKLGTVVEHPELGVISLAVLRDVPSDAELSVAGVWARVVESSVGNKIPRT